jgi:hypothetical protein
VSGYVERIASLAIGYGPRLRPRPRYRFADAPLWAPGDPAAPHLAIEHEPKVVRDARLAPVTADPPRAQKTQRTPREDASPPDAPDVRLRATSAEPARRLLPLRQLQTAPSEDGPTHPASADASRLHEESDVPEQEGAAPRTAAPTLSRPRRAGTVNDGFDYADPGPARNASRLRSRDARLEPARRDPRADEPPTVVVRIGHIDVRAVHVDAPAAPTRAPANSSSPRAPSLDAYLKTRDRGRA